MRGVVDVLWVGFGGFIGSSLRFAVSGWVHRLTGASNFPYGTLAVNVLGCLLIGLVGGWADHRQMLSATARLFVLMGMLGGFTTYSTFAYETLAFAQGSDALRAAANISLHLLLGLGAAWLGYTGARGL